MNKVIKMVLPLFIVAILASSATTQAAYGVIVGNTFDYEVVAASWDITIDTDTSSGTGVSFMDVNRPVGTQLEVEVTGVAMGVDYEITVGTDTDTGSNSPFDVLGVLFLTMFPLLLAESSVSGTWNQTEADLGLGLNNIYFVDPDSFSGVFAEMAKDDFVTSISDPEFDFQKVGGTFENSTNIAVFEWHFDMTFSNATDNFAGTFTWQYAYDQTDGHMKGQYMDIDYSGTMGGIAIDFDIEQKVEEVGYNLPGVTGIPGFEWFIAIPIIALLGGMTIIRRKRK